jgi:hypothetical protein
MNLRPADCAWVTAYSEAIQLDEKRTYWQGLWITVVISDFTH